MGMFLNIKRGKPSSPSPSTSSISTSTCRVIEKTHVYLYCFNNFVHIQTQNYFIFANENNSDDPLPNSTTPNDSFQFNPKPKNIEKPKTNKKNKSSKVLSFFRRSTDNKFAKCLNCDKEYRTSGNTSNLSDHLKRFHYRLISNDINEDTSSSNMISASTSGPSGHSSVRYIF